MSVYLQENHSHPMQSRYIVTDITYPYIVDLLTLNLFFGQLGHHVLVFAVLEISSGFTVQSGVCAEVKFSF